jgi:hypothetical protein
MADNVKRTEATQARRDMNWEYLTCRIEIDPHENHPAQINELGRDGWELVELVTIQDVAHQYRAFFKRPLPA